MYSQNSSLYSEAEQQKRCKAFEKERYLEVKREGVPITIENICGLSQAYLRFDTSDLKKIKSMIDARIKLQIYCLEEKCVVAYLSDEVTFDSRGVVETEEEGRLYFRNKRDIRQLTEGGEYVLVKKNATFEMMLKMNSANKNQIFISQEMCEFINNDHYVEIPPEPMRDAKNQIVQIPILTDLNASQNEALQKSLKHRLTFVKGPPGCGKTRTISELAIQFAQRGIKVVIGGVSNIANLAVLKQLAKILNSEDKNSGQRSFSNRMSKPVNNIKVSVKYSKWHSDYDEEFLKYGFDAQIAYEIQRRNRGPQMSFDHVLSEINKVRSSHEGKEVSRSFYCLYMESVNRVVSSIDILICTTVSAEKFNKRIYPQNWFRPQVAIMDEASQAKWEDPYCYISMGVDRMIMIGDEKQLEPLVVSQNQVLKKNMFGALSTKNMEYFTLLDTQYRMKPQIAEFPNSFLYEGRLKNAEIAHMAQKVYPRVCESAVEQKFMQYIAQNPVTFIQHNNTEEQRIEETKMVRDGKSNFVNSFEIEHISYLVCNCFPLLEMRNLGIITFYEGQAAVLRERLAEYISQYGLTIKTIDSYQGGEKDYTLFSTVRCNVEGKNGFCKSLTRVNVAITRARKSLIIYGNPYTLMSGFDYDRSNEIDSQSNSEIDPKTDIWINYLAFLSSKNRVLTAEEFNGQAIEIPETQNQEQKLIQHFV